MSFHPTTQRLVLRAPMMTDQQDFLRILNDFDVVKNLAPVPYPYSQDHFRQFVVHCDQASRSGMAHTCVVTRAMDGALIGLCAVNRLADGVCDFGYWYGRPYWGQGYASEAAGPVMRFAFEDMGAERLTAGWFDDNPASGAVLHKLGFAITGVKRVHSLARGCEVLSNRVLLTRDEFARKKAA